jgi:hypothetical protein
MQTAPLIISQSVTASLRQLRETAATKPVEMLTLSRRLATAKGKKAHVEQMKAQTVEITGPWPFLVTFSIETGHPCGLARHMSMSIRRRGRVPSPEAVWMVAEILGFAGGIDACRSWPEDLAGHGVAINLLQPVAT